MGGMVEEEYLLSCDGNGEVGEAGKETLMASELLVGKGREENFVFISH